MSAALTNRMTPEAAARGRRATSLGLVLAGLAFAELALAGAAPVRDTGLGVPAARVPGILRQATLRTLSGETVSLGGLRGEVVVLNFWASWCSPCREELPRLDALHAELARRGGRVIAVSIDLEARNAERFVRRHKLSLPIVHDGPDGLARRLDLRHVPFTIVLDRDGNVAYTASGSDAVALDALCAAARQVLAAKPVAARGDEGGAR